MRVQLKDNKIRFVESEHRYYNEKGEELQGITSTIIRWMFPNTYDGIPQHVLDAAAEHGKYVHKCIEMSDAIGATDDCPESQEFLDMIGEHKMSVIAHEYIVTAYNKFASPIDVVLQDEDGGIWLGDIKATSSLLEPKVRLQLSIYALFFEMNNPDLKVKGIVEIWLPKQQYRQKNYNGWQVLTRTSAKDTDETICAYFNLYDPMLFLPRFTNDTKLPAKVMSVIYEIAEQERMAKFIKKQTDDMKAALLLAFEEYGVKKFETADVIITKIEPSVRNTLDSKMVKDEYPEVYANCIKQSTTSSSIKITLR